MDIGQVLLNIRLVHLIKSPVRQAAARPYIHRVEEAGQRGPHEMARIPELRVGHGAVAEAAEIRHAAGLDELGVPFPAELLVRRVADAEHFEAAPGV